MKNFFWVKWCKKLIFLNAIVTVPESNAKPQKNDIKWPKTTQSVKTRRKMAKTNPKSKEKFA